MNKDIILTILCMNALIGVALLLVGQMAVGKNLSRRVLRRTIPTDEARLGLDDALLLDIPRGRSAKVVRILDRIGLGETPELQIRLRRAGFRAKQSLVWLRLAMLLTPLATFLISYLYLDLIAGERLGGSVITAISLCFGIAGWFFPEVLLRNIAERRKQRIRRSWPDALDVLHLCVNAGMGLEAALATVAREVRLLSPDVAQELSLTVSELAYLPDRLEALENLAIRTDLRMVREVVTTLQHSERHGTALGPTVKSLALEGRAQRFASAEKKAASLPPKLTVPMILFFLPVLFVIVGTPVIIQIFDLP